MGLTVCETMGLMKKKKINMTIHFQPRAQESLSSDDKKQLTDFFVAVMDLRPKEKITKGKTYDADK